MLEEPPERALLLLVSHSAARVLPTLRSRCRILTLRPLVDADVAQAAAAATAVEAGDPQVIAAAAAAGGSVARALSLMDEGALALRDQALAMLERLPALDAKALHALGEALAGTDPERLTAFVDTVNVWLSRRLHGGANGIGRLDRLAEAWQQVNAAARDAEIYNLERKPLIFKGVPTEIRTPVTALKGPCPGPLDDGDGERRRYLRFGSARLQGRPLTPSSSAAAFAAKNRRR